MSFLWHIILEAPPGGVITMARQLMNPVQLANPEVAFVLNLFLAPGDVPIEPEKSEAEKRDIVKPLEWGETDSKGLLGFGLALADADSKRLFGFGEFAAYLTSHLFYSSCEELPVAKNVKNSAKETRTGKRFFDDRSLRLL